MKRIYKLIIFLLGMLALGVTIMIDSLNAILFTVYLYSSIVVLSYSRNGPADPRVFPVAFMAIYFTFFPIRASIYGTANLPYDQDALLLSLKLQFLAIVIFVTATNLFAHDTPKNLGRPFLMGRAPSLLSEWLILLVAIPFNLYYIFIISHSEASSKRDIIENYSTITIISDFFILAVTILVFLRAVRIGEKFYRDRPIILYLVFCTFYVLLTGERDILFKVLFGTLIIYYDQRKNFGPLKMVTILSAILLIVPLSQYFKSILLSGTIDINLFGADLFLSSEFISSSRNFYSLLAFDVEHNVSFLWSDMARALIPTTLLGDYGVQSTVAWYNDFFRAEHGFQGTSGWGFTIVGFGYIVGGVTGIIFTMIFYAWLLSAFYNRRWGSLYWYCFYILALSAFVYILRADLANLLSLTFKVSGLCILAIYMTHRLLQKPSDHDRIKDAP